MADFATYLKEARERAGLNQSDLAGRAGLTGSYISILENRKKPPPSDAVLRRLAKVLRRPEPEVLEIAHIDRAPEDLRKKIRTLDRRLSLEQRITKRLLTDFLPSSLWHFWRVRGYQESGLEKLRLDTRKKRILRKVLRRIGHLTSRADFEEESRLVVETLPVAERVVLAEVLPELVPEEPGTVPGGAAGGRTRALPLLAAAPPRRRGRASPALDTLPVSEGRGGPDAYFLAAPDDAMEPRIEEGDLLLVDPGACPAPGALALVRSPGGPTVRQVAKGGDPLLLTAAHPKVAPSTTRSRDVLGVVLEIRRRLA